MSDRSRRNATGAAVTFGGLAVLAASAMIVWSWRLELPHPVASHWGADGRPDGFSSLGELAGVVLGLGGLLVLVFGAGTWGLGQTAVSRRIGAGMTAWVSVFLAIVLVGSLYVQRGLSDARQAPGIGGVLLVAVLGSLVLSVVVAAAVPGDTHQPTTEPVEADAPRVAAMEGARWTASASTPAGFLVGIPVAALLLVIAVLTRVWAVLAVDGVVIAALVTLSAFVVRVDREGLTVRSALGWPRYRVPLDEVVRADVTHVAPFREFGGWGWRVGRGGRVGLVLRKGEALLVERTGHRSIVVTIDDAATGAGLLNALADQQRPGSRWPA